MTQQGPDAEALSELENSLVGEVVEFLAANEERIIYGGAEGDDVLRRGMAFLGLVEEVPAVPEAGDIQKRPGDDEKS